MGEKKEIAPRLRTYERDVAEFMAREGTTAASAALAEQEKRIETRDRIQEIKNPPPASPPPPLEKEGGRGSGFSFPSPRAEALRARARSLFLWGILVVVLAGVVGAGVWYYRAFIASAPAANPTPKTTSRIILADSENMVDVTKLSRDSFFSAFARERAAQLPLSSFSLVTPAQGDTPFSAVAFLELLRVDVSGSFVRSLKGEFALGLRGLPANRAFLIFKANDYHTAFAGMLSWEQSMVEDIGPLFGAAIGGAAGFADQVVQNRDTRVFSDANGAELLVWGFADQETIIIASDTDSFSQLLGRLVRTK